MSTDRAAAPAPSPNPGTAPGHSTGPRVLADVADVVAPLPGGETGAAWRLEEEPRDLDVNLVRLPAGGTIEEFTGPGLDILVHVVAGSGTLHSAGTDTALRAGQIAWLPQGTRRGFTAGAEGLAWLTVHQRKPGLRIGSRPPQD